ncbi:MAG: DUF3397 domain-containing protein [Lysinibacillus sp.]
MKEVLHIIVSLIIFCPVLIFVVTFFICKKIKFKATHAFGAASDMTTFWLFFSVPLAVSALWQVNIGLILMIMALLLAILFTFVEWRSKKEIEVKPLLRKIWRLLFLLLSVSYIIICLVGLIMSVVEYLQDV